MGNQNSVYQKCNFEDIQNTIKQNNLILINTLDTNEQECLIQKSIPSSNEENIINSLLKNNINTAIFIYGKNTNDEKPYIKYKQLYELGFTNIYIYSGGLFEWLCLQDIYGDDEFPTTTKELDIIKFKPKSDYKKFLLLED